HRSIRLPSFGTELLELACHQRGRRLRQSEQRSIPAKSFVQPASIRNSRTLAAMVRGESPTFAAILSSELHSVLLHEIFKNGRASMLTPCVLKHRDHQSRTHLLFVICHALRAHSTVHDQTWLK